MPGNQTSPDRNGEVEIKVSYMVKRSQGKSALGAVNFKKRVFVLTPSRLTYYDGTLEVRCAKGGGPWAIGGPLVWGGGAAIGVVLSKTAENRHTIALWPTPFSGEKLAK